MVDDGHHAYIANNRGTPNAYGHTTLDVINDAKQYWDFSFDEMSYDALANMEAMYKSAGQKGTYFGYSQGTASMFVALSRWETQIAEWVNKAVMMGPCVINNMAYVAKGLPLDPGFLPSVFNPLGIYSLGGPNWANDSENICNNVPDFCDFAKAIPEGAIASAIKGSDHPMQLFNTGRFATYVENFSAENNQGELYDVEGINTIPISFIVSPNDKYCLAEATLEMSKRLSTMENFTYIEGEESGHLLFGYSSNPNLVRAFKRELESAVSGEGVPNFDTVYLDKEYVEPVEQDDLDELWDMLFDSSVSMAAPAATLTALFAAAMLQ